MSVDKQINEYIASQPEPKRGDMATLHRIVRDLIPKGKLWFLDGKDESGKTVSNSSVGYGMRTIRYASGKTREFYQIGISANTTGISFYVLGIEDRKYLAQTYGKRLGKAKVTGYCITFKALGEIDVGVLKAAMQDGIDQTTI